jgi:hypothetical protein
MAQEAEDADSTSNQHFVLCVFLKASHSTIRYQVDLTGGPDLVYST